MTYDPQARQAHLLSLAQGFVDYVGTTVPSGQPTIMGMAFLVVVAAMIVSLIWVPRK